MVAMGTTVRTDDGRFQQVSSKLTVIVVCVSNVIVCVVCVVCAHVVCC